MSYYDYSPHRDIRDIKTILARLEKLENQMKMLESKLAGQK